MDRILQNAANDLLANADPPMSKQIFQAAVDSIAASKKTQELQLFKELSNIQDVTQLQQRVLKEQQDSRTFGPNTFGRVNHRLANVAGYTIRAKTYVDSFAQISPTFLMPVWGTVLLLVTLVQDIPAIGDSIKQLRKEMEKYDRTFAEHFMTGHAISDSLKLALQSFYVCIVEACLQISAVLKVSRAKIYLVAHNGQAKSKLESFVARLQIEARQVYDAANAESSSRTRALLNASAYSTTPRSTSIQAPAANPATAARSPQVRYISCPKTTHFVGREFVLGDMTKRLGPATSDELTQIALWGPPGMGKSQTSLQLDEFPEPDQATSKKYDYVFLVRASSASEVAMEIRRVVVALDLSQDALVPSVDIGIVVEIFRKWLRENQRWLLIFDDISLAHDLHSVRPHGGQGHVVYNTRSKEVAHDLCGPNMTIEMRPMNASDTRAFTRSLLNHSSNDNLAASDWESVTSFAKGLPLAIETLVHYAHTEGLSLMKALEAVKSREILLRQRNDRSFHVHNYSVGAILVTSWEGLHQRYPMAAALFQQLVYLRTSSISVSMLREGSAKLRSNFDRKPTYDRGALRTPEGDAAAKMRSARLNFDLFDYDPLSLEDWKRMLRFGTFGKKHLPLGLPRIDSASDVELQQYWSTCSLLKHVFADPVQLTVAFNQLKDSGLVRTVDIDTLWIHDLYAELMVAYIRSESVLQNRQLSHLASAMVFLSLPTVELRYKSSQRCYHLLPHAEAAFGHLKTAGILADATIGAELAHVIASAIHQRWRFGGNGDITKEPSVPRHADPELAKAIEYYRLAFTGYHAAWKRLNAHPMVNCTPVTAKEVAKGRKKDQGLKMIMDATLSDFEFEEAAQVMGKGWQYYSCQRYIAFGYERFGSSAPWRVFQTALKLGVLYQDLEDWDEAISWMRQGSEGIHRLFGGETREVDQVKESLMSLLVAAKRYEEALDVVQLRMDLAEEKWGQNWQQGENCFLAMQLWKVKAICLKGMGKWVQSKWLWEKVWRWRLMVYGDDDTALVPVAEELARLCGELGEKEKEVEWWVRGLKVSFANEDSLDEEMVNRCVEGLRDVVQLLGANSGITEKVEELVEEIESDVENWVQGAPKRRERARQRSQEDDRDTDIVMSDGIKWWLQQGKLRGFDFGTI